MAGGELRLTLASKPCRWGHGRALADLPAAEMRP